MLGSGPGVDLVLCGPGKLLSVFEPQCVFLKNGHNNNTNLISVHSFIQYIFMEHQVSYV